MVVAVDWNEVAKLLDALYVASERLEVLFPGRKFALDGHLVGSVGEVIAAFMFDLSLNRASTRAHDATDRHGRKVEIKLTQGTSAALRHEPEHLLVLQRLKGRKVEVVYNGPGRDPWQGAGKLASNGQRRIGVNTLRTLDEHVQDRDRLRLIRQAPV